MPLYDYRCSKGHEFTRFLKIADYKKPQECECGEMGERVIKPTMLNCDIQPWDHYVSPASGKLITSYKERREDMKRHDCVDYEPSLKNEITKKMHDEDAKLEKRMDQTVEKLIEEMPVRKREKLASELKSGADCAVERR